MRRTLIILAGITTHALFLAAGFVLGIYMLPILTERPSPDAATLEAIAENAIYSADITEDLPGNDFLHWGEGTISLTPTQIVHEGELAPGPDYVLYLVPQFVEDEDEFLPLQDESQAIGPVNSFEGFALDIPGNVDVDEYTTVLIWCEAFAEFIAAAQYR